TRTSSLLPVGKALVPCDSERITQLDNEGTNKTIIDHSRPDFDQLDKTQSTGLEESIPDPNKGKTTFEVEQGNIPRALNFGQIQNLLADSEEELPAFGHEEVFAAGDEMDIDKPENIVVATTPRTTLRTNTS
nr:hypothetical protein [Tanacetum cinerariifolium]